MAEITYYFNSRSTGNWANPDNMIDGILTSYASTNAKGTTEILDSNTCPGTDLGGIITVKIRAYGYGDGNDQIMLGGISLTMPSSPGWSSYASTGIATWAGIVALDATVEYTAVGKANSIYCAKVEIRVTYWVPPVSDIDIGAIPVDRVGYSGGLYTRVGKGNPANASGTLHSIKIYAYEDMSGLRVGTFYLIGENTLKCRDSVVIGEVLAGAERTFTGLSIAVEVGDYIGFYRSGPGTIKSSYVGFAGEWYEFGEHISPGDEAVYSFAEGDANSLYGYGDIGAPPTYYHGLKVQGEGELALCDVGSHPLRMRKGGTTCGIELVAIDDPNASRIRVKTGAGIKAIRKYT